MIRNLFTATSGLQGHQTLLDVVGNNLANVNTTAFKAERLRFSDQFSDVLRAHTGPTGSIGGTNPNQVGQGVKVAAIDSIMTQGALETTGNNLDLAIEDEGFFVVRNGDDDFYTRAGAFSIDGGGRIVDSATGYRLQRTGTVGDPAVGVPGFQSVGDNSITIPIGASIAGEATSLVNFVGNLDSAAIGPRQEQLRINSALTTGGSPAALATNLNALDQTSVAFADGDEILITGTTIDGQSVSGSFVYEALARETVQDLINTINDVFGGNDGAAGTESPDGATAALDANGFITLTANRAIDGNLTVNLSTSDTTPLTGVVDFNNFARVTDGKEGDRVTSTIDIFDDQGGSHTLTFTLQKMGDNVWDLIASIGAAGTFAGHDSRVANIRFNEDGSLQSVDGTDSAQVLSTSIPLTVPANTDPLAPPLASTTAAVDATLGVSTALNALSQTTGTYTAGDDIRVDFTPASGGATQTALFDLAVGTETVQDLITFLNSATVFDSTSTTGATVSLSQSGELVVTANTLGPSQLSLALTTVPGASATTTFDAFTETTPGTDGDDDITFEITNLAGFNTLQTVRFGLGTVGGFDGLTQFGNTTTAAATEQNGSAPGALVDVAVQSDGVINGLFDNGRTIGLAQLAIATFTNTSGLDRVASNYFKDNTNSGTAVLGVAGAGGRGTIHAGVLENSNVDVAVEFTRLITAQRGFQVNARSFTTANSVLDETVNLVR